MKIIPRFENTNSVHKTTNSWEAYEDGGRENYVTETNAWQAAVDSEDGRKSYVKRGPERIFEDGGR